MFRYMICIESMMCVVSIMCILIGSILCVCNMSMIYYDIYDIYCFPL